MTSSITDMSVTRIVTCSGGTTPAQLIIPGAIIAGDPVKDPKVLAEHLWDLHTKRDRFRYTVGG